MHIHHPEKSDPIQNGAGDRGRTGTIGKDRGILSPVRLPVPPLRHSIFLEATPRFELGIKELQSTALPLGYVAVLVIHPRLERGTP